MGLCDFTITRFQFARDRVIGDSQVRVAHCHIGVLELHTTDGITGTGFFFSLFHPLPALAELERVFRTEAWPGLAGERPAVLLNRIGRPRGGNIRGFSVPFEQAVNQALWDLQGKALGLPLWRLLGGRDRKVRLYASGLDFHLGDAQYRELFSQARAQGYRGFKIKVGHPDLEWDLRRLAIVGEIAEGVGPIMVDANEAWSPKEAIRRLKLYLRGGHDILWVEDPCLRDDFEGLREVRLAVPEVLVNTGEYLDLHGKRKLIDARAVDILNVHGVISDVMRAGWLAAEHGLEVSLGNTSFEIGVHLAAALPECRWMEYSFQNYAHLLQEPVELRDGHAYAPDRPGHGLALSDRARRELAVPEVASAEGLPAAPQGPIDLSRAAA
jgi:L-alanine-DL-glutamate epimerase-like enolase superfamily enzyme